MALLEVVNVEKKYGDFLALNDMNFHVNAGEIVALIGKNGAGKTTILNSITGRIFPTKGDILYKGTTLLKSESLLNEFGVLIEPTFIPYMNAADNLKIIARLIDLENESEHINRLLDMVGLKDKKHKKTGTFSFGMKQRLGLAQALLNFPQFLILDEPFVGLDPIGKTIFKDVIRKKAKEEGTGVLFSSHDLEDVEEICDRIVLIDSGVKKFDGVMQYDKKLVLKCSGTIDVTLFENEDEVEITDDMIMFEKIDRLPLVIQKINESGMQLIDYDVEKKSLYDFFIPEEDK